MSSFFGGGASGGGGDGNMNSAVYDPQSIADDAFDMEKHTEGATKKILTAAERTKLAGVETGATADQTGAEIKAAYEAESNTNAFTDGEKTKLAGVEASADVTDATNVGTSVHGATAKETPVDADTMALIDSAASNVLVKFTWARLKAVLKAYFDTLYSGGGGGGGGDMTAAVYDPQTIAADAFSADNHTDGTTNKVYTATEKTKLGGIETGATGDQSGAEIKTAYEAEANTNAYTDAEKTKLGGIETGATGDQTGAEIKTAYEAEADTNAYTDAEKSKLAGVATGADVTNAAMGAADAVTSIGDTDTFATRVSDVLKKITWANVKAVLKTYFDTLYEPIGGGGGGSSLLHYKESTDTPASAPTAAGTGAISMHSGSTNAGTNTIVALGGSANSSGVNGVAMGQGAAMNANFGYALARGAAVTGQHAGAFAGWASSATGLGAVAIGARSAEAVATYGVVLGGFNGRSLWDGASVHSPGMRAAKGDRGVHVVPMGITTTNATETELRLSDGSGRVVLPAGRGCFFNGRLISYEPATGDVASWTFEGVIRRDGSNNTALVAAVTPTAGPATAGAAAWALAITADDTNESLKVAVTGEADHTINHTCRIEIEVAG